MLRSLKIYKMVSSAIFNHLKSLNMKISTLIFFTLLVNVLFAQQDPLHSQYMLNPLLINPAYAGLNNNFNGTAGYRVQWTGLEGHPQTMHASAHTSLVNNKIGA